MVLSILIAIGLNFDTFSVAIVEGSRKMKSSITDSLKVGVLFGIGQGGMALLGSLLGVGFKFVIMNVDHWVAFLLLSLIGGKLIIESKEDGLAHIKTHAVDFQSLSLLVLATSIDALVVGITLVFIGNSIITDVLVISITTCIIASVGYHSGEKLKKLCKNNTKLIGGLILILIGIKILLQHLFISG